jgi:hypothetical protein
MPGTSHTGQTEISQVVSIGVPVERDHPVCNPMTQVDDCPHVEDSAHDTNTLYGRRGRQAAIIHCARDLKQMLAIGTGSRAFRLMRP